MNSNDHDIKKRARTRQKGGVLVFVAFSLVLFVAFAAFTIDLGYLFIGRNELQNAADAAALGAARKLGSLYQDKAFWIDLIPNNF